MIMSTDSMSDEAQAHLEQIRAVLAGERAGGASVLHVDGDDDAALMLAALLMPQASVTHAATLAEAEQAITDHRYALVVLDPDLPDGDGAHLLAALCRHPAPTPVLLYASRQPQPQPQPYPQPQPHARTPAQTRECVFLPKPHTTPRQLWHALAQLLELPAR